MTAAMVKTATRADTDKCEALIALAFSNDPAARWAYKDPAAYLEHFPPFVRAFSCARSITTRRITSMDPRLRYGFHPAWNGTKDHSWR